MFRQLCRISCIVFTSMLIWGCGGDEPEKIELPKGDAARGENIYGRTCTVCHGLDGNANTQFGKRLGVKKLTDANRMSTFSDEDIGATIENGKGKMPGFRNKFTPQDLADTIEFVKGLSGK
ncbi:MAG: cytochrome c [Planctomycetota bacterium]|nr:cytochrome c [Planctomycetota bacterium]